MLMITRTEGNDLTRTLKLEGKLLGPWIGELKLARMFHPEPIGGSGVDI